MNYKGTVCALALVTLFSVGCTVKNSNQTAPQAQPVAAQSSATVETTSAQSTAEIAQNTATAQAVASEINPNFKGVGSYARENSSQYNNGNLVITDFSEGLKIFEFNILSGNEATDSATTYRLAGIFNVDAGKAGVGEFDSIVAGYDGKIKFKLSDDGKMINVTAEGEKNQVYVGSYSYTHSDFDISLGLVKAVLEELPGAATGLTREAGKYTIKLLDNGEPLAGEYYEAEAVNKQGQVIGAYVISKDLQLVLRTDIGALTAIHGQLTPEIEAKIAEALPKG
ncbi:TPA: hypothetical protein DD394_02175 [bacterium UBP9_UBA11836]|nr:hypothetical protein [bacterium UBP9_UBA11836]